MVHNIFERAQLLGRKHKIVRVSDILECVSTLHSLKSSWICILSNAVLAVSLWCQMLRTMLHANNGVKDIKTFRALFPTMVVAFPLWFSARSLIPLFSEIYREVSCRFGSRHAARESQKSLKCFQPSCWHKCQVPGTLRCIDSHPPGCSDRNK